MKWPIFVLFFSSRTRLLADGDHLLALRHSKFVITWRCTNKAANTIPHSNQLINVFVASQMFGGIYLLICGSIVPTSFARGHYIRVLGVKRIDKLFWSESQFPIDEWRMMPNKCQHWSECSPYHSFSYRFPVRIENKASVGVCECVRVCVLCKSIWPLAQRSCVSHTYVMLFI